MTVAQCRLVDLPGSVDDRGRLAFVEPPDTIPFEIGRVYYLFDIPPGKERGAHGHRDLQQLMIAVSGSFSVTLDDGKERKSFHLSRPDQGLYISKMIWRDLSNFSEDAVCLVLASERYSEDDYFRSYEDFYREATS